MHTFSEAGLMLRFLAFVLLAVFVTSCSPTGQETESTPWFKPKLSINSLPEICQPMQAAYLQSFNKKSIYPPNNNISRHKDVYSVILPSSIGELSALSWKELTTYTNRWQEINYIRQAELPSNNKSYTLSHFSYAGPRGERLAYVLHDEALSLQMSARELIDFVEKNRLVGFSSQQQNKKQTAKATLRKFYQGMPFQSASLQNVYSQNQQLYWAFNYSKSSDNHFPKKYLGLFKMTDNLSVSLLCEIETQPEADEIKIQQQKIDGLTDYLQTVSEMMGSSGSDCSNSQVTEKAKLSFLQASQSLVYRPWVSSQTNKENGALARRQSAMAKWAYSGLWNYKKFQQFQGQQSNVAAALSEYIARNFSLPTETAATMASEALEFLLLESFRYGEVDDKYHALHRLVLEGKTEQVAAYSLPKDIDLNKDEAEFVGDDSLLVYALGQQDLLEMLLQKGLNVNKGNVFNKTPLMYAAQFNDLDSAQLLLQHGADPNIATTQASDTCNYNIKTRGLTALHYAARYASKAFMDMLLKHGALTTVKNSKNQTPLDYLQQYRSQNAATKPGQVIQASALSAMNVQQLESTLTPATKNTENSIDQANLEGEKLLKQNKNQEALNYFRQAISLDENNFRAKSNFSTAALRLKRYKEAAEVAVDIIQSEANKREKSTANFNLGLACEYNAKKSGYHFSSIQLESQMLCYPPGKTAIDYFLESYKLFPSDYKLQRLRKFLSKGDDGIIKRVCTPKSAHGLLSIYLSVHHIYFLLQQQATLPYNSLSSESVPEGIKILERQDIPLGEKLKVIRWRTSEQPASLDIIFDNGDTCSRIYN